MSTTTAETVIIKEKLYRFAGVTESCTVCGCCGRENLKKTVVLEPVDGGEFVRFGTGCAAKALGWANTSVLSAAKAGAKARRAALQAQLNILVQPFAARYAEAYKQLQAYWIAKCERSVYAHIDAEIVKIHAERAAVERAFWAEHAI